METNELRKELLISFNQQFAENHNHHQQSFIQVLSVLLTVLIGYGYVFTSGGKMDGKNIQVNNFLLEVTFLIASLITSFGLMLVINNAHGFRRDQFVVNRIRKDSKVIQINNSIFPEDFNPAHSFKQKIEYWKLYKSKKWPNPLIYIFKWIHFFVSWMPNFYNILFFVLGLLKIILLLSFLLNPFDNCTLNFDFNKSIHWGHLITFLLWLAGTWYVFNRLEHFRDRLINLYKISY